MIVPMRKIHLVARTRDRKTLLDTLRELGVMHLVPVDPEKAVADEKTSRQVENVQRALQLLSGVAPNAHVPQLSALEGAKEVLKVERRATEGRNHLATLYHQLEQIKMWGDMRLDHVKELRRAGVDLKFYAVPSKLAGEIEADCVEVVANLPGPNVLVGVANKYGEVSLPEEAELLPLPTRDAHSIRAEAKKVDEAIHEDTHRLHELSGLIPKMEKELARLKQDVEYTVAMRGAASDEALFALQGWAPAKKEQSVDDKLTELGIPAALEFSDPAEDDEPQTLITTPAWIRPIEGLFKMLGTIPGYREFDVSLPFLIALPIFTAILISDGGYGALLLFGPLLAYNKMSKAIGAQFTQLLMIVGAVSIVWGFITATFFGFELYTPLISISLEEASRLYMMRLSFTIGAIHLSIAQLWQAVRYFPDLRFLNKIGWAVFVWGMYGVVKMFVLKDVLTWGTPWPYLLIVGASLAILFATPSRNPIKMIAMGLAQFPLAMLSAFSDVISYVRLMAVGLASSVLAVSFNTMALDVDFMPLTVFILLVGHTLNVGLAMIAMFAHGVRLNMLEFSNNLGMQWIGYTYKPFTRSVNQEYTK